MASVEPSIRDSAFSVLQKAVGSLQPGDFRSLSIGIFYFFWYCDGAGAQEEASRSIAELYKSVETAQQGEWTKCLVFTLAKFWGRLDYHRQNKFLLLAKDIFEEKYREVLKGGRDSLIEWNRFVREEVLGKEGGRELGLELLFKAEEVFVGKCDSASMLFLSCKPFLDVSSPAIFFCQR